MSCRFQVSRQSELRELLKNGRDAITQVQVIAEILPNLTIWIQKSRKMSTFRVVHRDVDLLMRLSSASHPQAARWIINNACCWVMLATLGARAITCQLMDSQTGVFVAFPEIIQIQLNNGIRTSTLTGIRHAAYVRRISYVLGARSQFPVDTACSSSLRRHCNAKPAKRECELALVGGEYHPDPETTITLSSAHACTRRQVQSIDCRWLCSL
jgi:acyl transferase domain-containing protein